VEVVGGEEIAGITLEMPPNELSTSGGPPVLVGVLAATGEVVTPVAVALEGPRGESPASHVPRLTDAGRYRIEGVTPGTYRCSAFCQAEGTTWLDGVRVEAHQGVSIEVQYPVTRGRLEVTARRGGTPVRHALLEVLDRSEGHDRLVILGPGRTTLVADQEGHAVTSWLPAGTYTVRLSDLGGRSCTRTVTVPADGTTLPVVVELP
jgi:hypothetical protein